MDDELIVQVTASIEDQLTAEDGWEVGTPQLRRMCEDFALAAIATLQPYIAAEREDAARRALDAAATVPPGKTTSNGCETIGQWTRRTLREAIRAIDPAQFREAGNG